MRTATVSQPNPTLGASAGARENIRSGWVDLLVSSDPGLNRLRGAAQSVLTIAIALGAEWIFVRLTGALQIESAAGASVATALQPQFGGRHGEIPTVQHLP